MDSKEAQEIMKKIEKIKSIENAVGDPHYNLARQEEIDVKIEIDNKVSHGQFKPHPTKIGTWIASSQTFRAMKKNIFALDEEMIDLQDNYVCESCKTQLDRQFWNFCPYCGESFKK